MEDYYDDEYIEEITPEQITYICVNNYLHKVVSEDLNNIKSQIKMLANESDLIETGVFQNNVACVTLGALGLGTFACSMIGYFLSPTIALGSSVVCCAIAGGMIAKTIRTNRKMLKVNTGLQMLLAEEQEKYDAETNRLAEEIKQKERDMSYN